MIEHQACCLLWNLRALIMTSPVVDMQARVAGAVDVLTSLIKLYPGKLRH